MPPNQQEKGSPIEKWVKDNKRQFTEEESNGP